VKIFLEVERIRRDFPILESGVIYFDNAASSLTPEPVLEKVLEFYRQYRANVERGIHRLSKRASDEYENVRAKVAKFINAKSELEIILTKNTTEGINTVANGLRWTSEDKIVTTLIEHHSNFIPWLRVQRKYGVDVEIVKPKNPMKKGLFDIEDFERSIDDRTKLVAITHVSNVLGTVLPVKEIAEIAHEHGAYVLIDGAQSVPHVEVDVQKIRCDFLAFSGHKMCAPTGTGVLYIREEVFKELEPLCIGGGTVADAGLDYYQLENSPARFESGTPAIGEIIGLGAAIDYLKKIGINNIRKHETFLTEKIYEGLVEISKVDIYGPEPDRKIGITSFNIEGFNPNDVALMIDFSANIMVRSGHHCAIPLTKVVIGKLGSVRVSTYLYNTIEEVEKFITVIEEITKTVY